MPEVVKIEDLPTLRDAGFTGGRDNLHAFCRTIFASGAPRYLRTDQNALVVFRHADLMAFGTAPQIGNVPPGVLYPGRMDAPTAAEAQPGKRVAEVLATQVFTTNPPIHGPTRRILLDWIGPKQISDMESLARNVASDIVGGLTSGSEIDFVPIVAEALIIGFWSRLLRLSDDEAEAIATAARDMTRLFIVNRSSDDLLALDRAFDDYARILDAAAARGLQHGDPALVEIERQLQTLDFEEDIYTVGVYPRTVGEVLSGNLIDGFHTAALASANACYALSRHPDALEQARNSAPTLAKAIAEALRLEPPVLMLKRYALADFEYSGAVVPRDTQVVMMWGAGNLDPQAFPEPEKFDLSRRHQGLTTFGSGIHICPGRHIGMMLARILLEEFHTASVAFAPGQREAEWLPGHIMSQLRTLPMRIERQADEVRLPRSG